MLVASSLLVFATTSASALRSLEINPTLATNTGRVAVNYADMARRIRIACDVTLGLEYVRVLSKAAAGNLAQPIGSITEARTANCREGANNWEVTVLVGSGIPMRYNGFLGDLPNITGLLITALEVGVRIRRNLTNCLFVGNLPFLVFERNGRQSFDQKRFLENRLLWAEGMECPMMSRVDIAGTLTIAPAIVVRLI